MWCYINYDKVFCVGVAEKKNRQYWNNNIDSTHELDTHEPIIKPAKQTKLLLNPHIY